MKPGYRCWPTSSGLGCCRPCTSGAASWRLCSPLAVDASLSVAADTGPRLLAKAAARHDAPCHVRRPGSHRTGCRADSPAAGRTPAEVWATLTDRAPRCWPRVRPAQEMLVLLLFPAARGQHSGLWGRQHLPAVQRGEPWPGHEWITRCRHPRRRGCPASPAAAASPPAVVRQEPGRAACGTGRPAARTGSAGRPAGRETPASTK